MNAEVIHHLEQGISHLKTAMAKAVENSHDTIESLEAAPADIADWFFQRAQGFPNDWTDSHIEAALLKALANWADNPSRGFEPEEPENLPHEAVAGQPDQ